MWTCSKCGRVFERKGQMHSCRKFPVKMHFKNKKEAEELYNNLLKIIKKRVGEFKIISLPCCIHLYGKYDFIALLPKKDKLEIRFSLDNEIKNSRIYISFPLSSKSFKNCLYVKKEEDINKELISWLKESYHLKD